MIAILVLIAGWLTMRFRGVISSSGYAWAVFRRVAVFVGATMVFPFLVFGFLRASGCGQGSCGAGALVIMFYSKPLIYLAFCLSFLGITVRRLRDVGLPVWISGAVVILLLGDLQFGMLAGSPWSVSFVMGGPGAFATKFLVSGLLCMAAIAIMGESAGTDPQLKWWRVIFAVAIAAAAATAVYYVVDWVYRSLFAMLSYRSEPIVGRAALSLTIAPLAAGVLAVMSWRARGAPDARSVWALLVAVCCLPLAVSVVQILAGYIVWPIRWVFDFPAPFRSSAEALLSRRAMGLALPLSLLLPLFVALMLDPDARIARWASRLTAPVASFFRRLSPLQGLTALGLGLVGLLAWSYVREPAWVPYRLTLEVATPDGVHTGSGVRVVTVGRDGDPVSVRGEAISVDLGSRGTLVALLAGRRADGKPCEDVVLPELVKTLNPGAATLPDAAARIEALEKVGGKAELPPADVPFLIYYRDINDPSAGIKVDPGDVAAVMGPGVSLQRATVAVEPKGWWPFNQSVRRGVALTANMDEFLRQAIGTRGNYRKLPAGSRSEDYRRNEYDDASAGLRDPWMKQHYSRACDAPIAAEGRAPAPQPVTR